MPVVSYLCKPCKTRPCSKPIPVLVKEKFMRGDSPRVRVSFPGSEQTYEYSAHNIFDRESHAMHAWANGFIAKK